MLPGLQIRPKSIVQVNPWQLIAGPRLIGRCDPGRVIQRAKRDIDLRGARNGFERQTGAACLTEGPGSASPFKVPGFSRSSLKFSTLN